MTATLANAQIAVRLIRHLNAAGFEVSTVDVMRTSIYAHLTGPGDDHDSRPSALHVATVAHLVVSNINDLDTCTTVDTTFEGVAVTIFGVRRSVPEPALDPRTLRSIAGYACPCGARGWLQEGASDEDRAAFDAEVATHDDCEVPA